MRSARWGGARDGAGRPVRGTIASEPHKARPAISPVRVLAVRVRLVDAVRRALAAGAIEQLAIRRRAIDLVVRAGDARALARGMQGFQVSAARALNRRAQRTGQVFADRYSVRARRAR